MLDITLLGCGGTMPLPGRHLSALTLLYNGHRLLIDCGEGTQVAMRRAGTGFKNLDAILLTHLHADHTAGLPGLLLTAGNAGRTEPVRLYGPAGVEELAKAVRAIAPEIPFPVETAEVSAPFELFGLRVEPFAALHTVPCFGYSLTLPRAGRFRREKAEALGVPVPLWHRLQTGETVEINGRTVRPEEVLGPARRGLKTVYCTDSRPVPALSEAAAGADLLVLEGMYYDPADGENAAEKRHMLVTEAAAVAAGAGAARLWLTHFSPKLTAPAELPEEALSLYPGIEPGLDGKTVTLRFHE